MEDEDEEDALAVLPREEKAQSSWWRRRPPAAAGIGGDGEDGGDPGEAEEGLERGPASRLHSNAATQRGGGGDWRAGRGLRKRRRGAAEARDPCGRRGFGFVLWTWSREEASESGGRTQPSTLMRLLPVAGRF